MRHVIGEIITLPDGSEAEVVESDGSCAGCVMVKFKLCPNVDCMVAERIFIDRKSIIYKKIKEKSV